MYKRQGFSCTLVNARFVKPIDKDLIRELAKDHRLFVTMEENVKCGGFGEHVLDYLNEIGSEASLLNISLPDDYIEMCIRDSFKGVYERGSKEITVFSDTEKDVYKRQAYVRLEVCDVGFFEFSSPCIFFQYRATSAISFHALPV